MNRYEFTKKAQNNFTIVDNTVRIEVDGIPVYCNLDGGLASFSKWELSAIRDEPLCDVWDRLWHNYIMICNVNHIPYTECGYHHMSYCNGYTSVKTFGKMYAYQGRFGKGYTVVRNATGTTRYSIKEYWIENYGEEYD